jgi:phasin
MQHGLVYSSPQALAERQEGNEMANVPYEIPNELRDFAERSVDQARKAFEGFVTVAQKTAGTVDGAANEARSGVKHVGSQILGYAEQNVNAAFDLAQKLVHVRDPQEALALQSEFLRAQLNALQNQARELGALIQKSVTTGIK